MGKSPSLSLNVPPDMAEKLRAIGQLHGRSAEAQALKMLEQAVGIEFRFVEMIAEGEADIAAGRVIPHEQVMAEVRARIANRRAA